MFTEKTRFYSLRYLLPVILIAGLFAFYHRLNNSKPVEHVVVGSAVDVEREAFEAKIGQVPGIGRARPIRLAQGRLNIQLLLPDHWRQGHFKSGAIEGTKFVSSDDRACVELFSREDRMPLLEAAMESPLMWLSPGIPYLGKSLVQTSIDSKPALVGHIRLRSLGREKPDDIYVMNALVVVDNQLSVVLRSCEGTPDEFFYHIYKSLKIGNI